MNIYYDGKDPRVAFGASRLIDALRSRGVYVLERRLSRLPGETAVASIILATADAAVVSGAAPAEAESFAIKTADHAIYVIGSDPRGAMYGALDLAEQVSLGGIEGVVEKTETPFLRMRGIKFNLPWEPYDTGDVFARNEHVCWDIDFWRQYIDMLAANRYNCLTLWSRHPFHLMFRLDKYPGTTPLSDAELEENMRFFRELFRHARDRGVDTYVITWCVDIIPAVIEGLGLPPHFADPRTSHAVRQQSEQIKDYFRECVKTLLLTYRDLTGIGTSASEEMVGDARSREQWVTETYLEGVKLSGRTVPFIHRTNMQSGKPVKELFADKYPGPTYISWKYSNAHMYSHPKPMFEELWGAWEGLDLDEIKVTYTVRNDDIHTLRWGDPEYVCEYVKQMKKPYVHGFYWGADGYIWGVDFQHAENGHKRWTYDFERQWYQFALWGRISYNPDLSEDTWRGHFRQRYGKAGDELCAGLKAASKIVPAVSRLFWVNYDFEWHPEGCLSGRGFRTIEHFVDGKAMPGSGVISIREYVGALREGRKPEGITPEDIIGELQESAEHAAAAAERVRNLLAPEEIDGDLECLLLDIEAWACLGSYYEEKFRAALHLAQFSLTAEAKSKAEAVEALQRARDRWLRLSALWSRHYKPYRMTRTKLTFGWPLYADAVERDIEMARHFGDGR